MEGSYGIVLKGFIQLSQKADKNTLDIQLRNDISVSMQNQVPAKQSLELFQQHKETNVCPEFLAQTMFLCAMAVFGGASRTVCGVVGFLTEAPQYWRHEAKTGYEHFSTNEKHWTRK